MDGLQEFLARAIRLESAAAHRADELADAMQTWGNKEVEAFFRKMGDYSRTHLGEAMAMAGFRHGGELPAADDDWPGGAAPESAAWWGVDGLMGIEHAIELAIEGEQRGLEYYEAVAAGTSNEKLRTMAEAFAAEERGHVAELRGALQKYRHERH
jgi:hypothetical protein